jgi:hypothetical protein
MVLAVTAIFLLERRASRASAERISQELGVALRDMGRKHEILASRVNALAGSIQEMQEAILTAIKATLAPILRPVEPESAAAPETTWGFRPDDRDGSPLSPGELDRLPPLPEGLQPDTVLADESLPELVTKYRADPERRLSGVETAKALNILAEARARLDLLQARTGLATVEAAEKLRIVGTTWNTHPGRSTTASLASSPSARILGSAACACFTSTPRSSRRSTP